jgi:dolichyl-phosphate-mannose-protein mannosyltransferase
MGQYKTQFVNSGDPIQSQVPVAQPQGDQQAVQSHESEAFVTPQPAPPANPNIVGVEEHVEYRDQAGNLLSPEQVAALQEQGNVSFQTKYQTQTRVIDADGRDVVKGAVHAPPHPDVEGQNPETNRKRDDGAARNEPASAAAGQDKSVRDEAQAGVPKPASEGNEATKQA